MECISPGIAGEIFIYGYQEKADFVSRVVELGGSWSGRKARKSKFREQSRGTRRELEHTKSEKNQVS